MRVAECRSGWLRVEELEKLNVEELTVAEGR